MHCNRQSGTLTKNESKKYKKKKKCFYPYSNTSHFPHIDRCKLHSIVIQGWKRNQKIKKHKRTNTEASNAFCNLNRKIHVVRCIHDSLSIYLLLLVVVFVFVVFFFFFFLRTIMMLCWFFISILIVYMSNRTYLKWKRLFSLCDKFRHGIVLIWNKFCCCRCFDGLVYGCLSTVLKR